MKPEHYLSNYFTPLKDMVNLGCDSILKVTEDSILNNLQEKYGNDSSNNFTILKELSKICKYFDYTDRKNAFDD